MEKARHKQIEQMLGRPVASRQRFIDALAGAVAKGRGFAAGKIGPSEQYWMIYPVLLEKATSRLGLRVFEKELIHHGLKNAGIFPGSPDFYLRYNEQYLPHVNNMDSLGVFLQGDRRENVVIRHYDLGNLIHYQDQEPDRSVPDNPANCYLPLFRGKRILLICTFASLLRTRATRESFEGVWAKTGKKWFDPRQVEALEFPYGFSPETHARYATSLDLLAEIEHEIEQRDFDIALIGAGGLALPIASFIKNKGRIALDLGGHLQVLFGVIGRRWRNQPVWRDTYFTDAWIDMPDRYKPGQTDVCDSGAYW